MTRDVTAAFMHVTANPEELIAVYREQLRLHSQDTFAFSILISPATRSSSTTS